MKKIDAGKEVSESIGTFWGFLMDHFIQLVVVGVSSTQTFFLIQTIAPDWAVWLPVFAVLLMEGGYLFWMWREFEADISDGSLADVDMNEQERIANRMVYITLALSVLTMLAGGFLEIAQSDLSSILASFPVLANWLALGAIAGIFILGGIHLFSDWRYRRADPDVALSRMHRANMRKLSRQRQEVHAKGEESVTLEEVKHTADLYNQNKQKIGTQRANQAFSSSNSYAKDVDQVDPTNGRRPPNNLP